jgi:hypothetical protein
VIRIFIFQASGYSPSKVLKSNNQLFRYAVSSSVSGLFLVLLQKAYYGNS